jgi:hypothetical protein
MARLPAMAENVTLAAPAGTTADAGVVRFALSSFSAIVVALVTGFVIVAVHVALAPGPIAAGVHESAESCAGHDTASAAVRVTPEADAVTVAF